MVGISNILVNFCYFCSWSIFIETPVAALNYDYQSWRPGKNWSGSSDGRTCSVPSIPLLWQRSFHMALLLEALLCIYRDKEHGGMGRVSLSGVRGGISLWPTILTLNISPVKNMTIFSPQKYSAMQNIAPRQIFTPEKYLTYHLYPPMWLTNSTWHIIVTHQPKLLTCTTCTNWKTVTIVPTWITNLTI